MYCRFLIGGLLICFVCGCTREVVIKVKEGVPKIVVSSITATGDLFEVYVSNSYSIFSERINIWDDAATDAAVSIYENDVLIEILSFDADSKTYKADRVRPTVGNTYRIEVSRPGFETVSATSEVPQPIPIETVVVEKDARQLNNQPQTGIRLSFTDISGDNYYGIEFTSPGGNKPCLYCRDAAIEKISDLDLFEMEFCYDADDLLMSDESFRNQEKQVQTYLEEYYIQPAPPEYASIALRHMNQAYFRFLTSRNLNSIVQGNPFAEPANVMGNINGGFGIFTVYSVSRKRIE